MKKFTGDVLTAIAFWIVAAESVIEEKIRKS
jgi:hypothetical protein